MTSKQQLHDLQTRVPPELLKPDQCDPDEVPKKALMRWAVARGRSSTEFRHMFLAAPDDDETCMFAMAGHICDWALYTQYAVEIEQERSLRISASEKQSSALPPLDERIAMLPALRRTGLKPGSKGQRTRLMAQAKRRLDSLQAARKQELSDIEVLGDFAQEFDAMRQQVIVPVVSSGYLNDPRRGGKLAEKTCLLFHLTGWGIPLLRAMAMIGELRMGSNPVVLDHPERDARFDRHEQQLKRLRKIVRAARVRSSPSDGDQTLASRGKKRHKRQRAAAKRKTEQRRTVHRRGDRADVPRL